MNKYARQITQTLADEDQGFTIDVDVYDVLRAFNVTDPAIQHAIKKLLCTGIRGHKDSRQDLEEAIQSIERALDVVKVEEKLATFANESQPVTSDNPQQSSACPFKVGDVIHHREDVRGRSEIKWKVTGFTTNSVQVVSDDVYRSPSHIERQVWHRYAKVEQPAAEATELPECPFKVGNVIQFWDPKTSETKWKITHIKDGKLLVTSYDTYQQRSWIELQFWSNYRAIDPIDGTPVDKPVQQCPFVVGDVIRSVQHPSHVFHVTAVFDDRIETQNRDTGRPRLILKAFWNDYEIKPLISIDKPAATC
jgi:hypothetical protein